MSAPDVDVVVVGAGPAGSCAAIVAALASAAQPSGTPLAISRNAMNVRKPVRVMLSTISTRHNAANAGLLRIPQPLILGFGLDAEWVCVLAIQR